jgi:hypothetical protein
MDRIVVFIALIYEIDPRAQPREFRYITSQGTTLIEEKDTAVFHR